LNESAVAQQTRGVEALAVHERAIAATQVEQHRPAGLKQNLAMVRADLVAVRAQMTIRGAPDQKPVAWNLNSRSGVLA